MTQARRKSRMMKEDEEPQDEVLEDEEQDDEEYDEDVEDEEQDEEEPVEPADDDKDEDEEEVGLPTNLSLSITEDSIDLSVPRNGNEARTLKRIAKLVDEME